VGFGLAMGRGVARSGLEWATGRKLVGAAHQMCPSSNSTRGNIDVNLRVA
jgi:organic hydroperoxide reductase OsmC/OhrA